MMDFIVREICKSKGKKEVTLADVLSYVFGKLVRSAIDSLVLIILSIPIIVYLSPYNIPKNTWTTSSFEVMSFDFIVRIWVALSLVGWVLVIVRVCELGSKYINKRASQVRFSCPSVKEEKEKR